MSCKVAPWLMVGAEDGVYLGLRTARVHRHGRRLRSLARYFGAVGMIEKRIDISLTGSAFEALAFFFRRRRAIALLAPDADHRVDSLLDVVERVDDAHRALAGEVLERAGGQHSRGLGLDLARDAGGVTAFRQLNRQFLEALDPGQNFRRGALGCRDDALELAGGGGDAIGAAVGRALGCDIPSRLVNVGADLAQLLAHQIGLPRILGLTGPGLLRRGELGFAQQLADVADCNHPRALVAHAQEGAPARVAGERFLDLEVFLVAQFRPARRHQRSPSTASIFFFSVSALKGFTM